MTARALNRALLARQGLLEPIRAPDAGRAVARLGSLQAQHPEWPPVALAARAADARTADLAGALERREAVRASLMRITIHVVARQDLWPLFAACQPMRLAQWRLLARADPTESPIGRRLTAAHATARAALRQRPRSSLELDRLIASEVDGIPDRVPRLAWRHFAALVPLVHVPHSGEGYGRSLYALAEDWLGEPMQLPRLQDARTHLARRYLAAFGPASVEDLVAYVGREGGIRPWREALEPLADELVGFRDDKGRSVVDLEGSPRPPPDAPAPPRLLARWDSALLSHVAAHRDRIISDEDRTRVFSKNADVLPTFLLDGRVAGTWDLARTAGALGVTLRPFRPLGSAAEALVAEAERLLGLLAPGAGRSVAVEA